MGVVGDILQVMANHSSTIATLSPRGEDLPCAGATKNDERIGGYLLGVLSYEEAITWLGEVSPAPEKNP